MPNIMSMKTVKNRPSKNGYDLSRRTCFTSKVGELLPVWWQYVLPGDTFNINLSSFTRTRPVNTASFGRVREYFDFFFVPLEQLWNKSPEVLTQMLNNVQHATSLNSITPMNGDLPSIASLNEINSVLAKMDGLTGSSANNFFNMKRSSCAAKVLSYLGYGQIDYEDGPTSGDSSTGYRLVAPTSSTPPELCLFPLLAYQKCYADFFRYTQWEKPDPSTFNLDWMTGNGDTMLQAANFTNLANSYSMFDMRYANYQKDLFHGLLPRAQYGETSAVSLAASSQADYTYAFGVSPGENGPTGSVSTTTYGSLNDLILSVSSTDLPYLRLKGVNQSQIGQFSILALRQAEALQKWKEIAIAAEEDYKSQIEAHWGVNASVYQSHVAQYLGGISSNVSINEVVNTNLVNGAESQPADLAGKGVGSSNGNITFDAGAQYGVIMCIYHALPLLDYITSGSDAKLFHVQGSSFPIPEMDSIGMELVPGYCFTNLQQQGDFNLGYAPRYIDWKTDYDRCVGDFANTMQSWILPYGDNEVVFPSGPDLSNPNIEPMLQLGYEFFKVNPSIVDPMFDVEANQLVTTDQLWNQMFVDCKVSRLLDVNGLPY